MDEATTAAFEQDGAGNESCRGDGPSGTLNKRPPLGEGVFCCRDCGEAFREEATYLKHCQQHSQENLSMFVDHQLSETRKHGIEKDSETTNFCNVCSLSFVELSDFHSHMEKEHRQTLQKGFLEHMGTGITKQHTYECSDCGKSYGVLGHFLNHQRSHRQASKSVFHDLEHLKKKSFQCESCGRTYSRASALDAHRRCHEEKLVKSRSRSSGDSFNTEDPMVEAKSSENQTEEADDKLFKCSCGKAFTALMRLKTHQRFSRNSLCSPEETKEKPKKTCNEFYCSQCNKTFSGHIALFNHQRWHTNHSDDSAQRYPCEECGKVFMTLTFYYRHQRTAHSEETPSKSFHHQVCQLQKKSFACKDCGLKFSRASALHSHELIHTDVFRETEKEARMHTPLLPQFNQNILESQSKDTGQMEEDVISVNVLSSHMAEEDPLVNDTDEDMESYEPGDLIVKVISASESEDEPAQDLNPDLELVCESDQEIRDDTISSVPASLVSKPEMDLNIVQIDFEHADELSKLLESEAESKNTERYDCPECYRWFTSASSLRVHRMWHGVHKRRQQAQGQPVAVYTCGICGQQNNSYASHCSHIKIHKDETPSNNVFHQMEGEEKNNLTCDECGKSFSRLSALVSHQLHHPKRKQFQCPDCMMSYSHAANLFNHMKICSALKKENISASKKEYNPKKTLLGPKIYHCEQCGKGFWSLGAYSHHKQSQTQCVDLRLRKGFVGTLHSVNGHSRSAVKVACPVCGRKFRHKGIMALHMRKHENGNHKCELCNRSFRLFSSLLRHQVVHNDQLLPPPIKSFQHQVEQLKKNTYSCPDCGKLFSRAKALQFHMKSHGYETGHSPPSQKSAVTLEDLQCSTCFAHFNNKSSLRAHQKLCTKKENQVIDCKAEPLENENTPESPKASVNVGTPEPSAEHFVVNTKIKNETETEEQNGAMWSSEKTSDLKYKCKTCDRSFSVIGALNFHKRVHTEGSKALTKAKLTMSLLKKPKQDESTKGLFHCSECGRRFMSNSALGSHKRWHKDKKFSHSLGKDDEANAGNNKAESGPFKCNKCGKQFFNHCVLQRHQMFNPQCQSTESEPDAEKSVESKSIPEQSEFACPESHQMFEQDSLTAEHFECEHSNSVDEFPEEGDVDLSESKSASTALKPKAYQCPICSMTFVKARGLRAHKWQAHSKGRKKIGLGKKNQLSCDVKKPQEASAIDGATVMDSHVVAKKTIPVATGVKKIRPDHIPVKSNAYINSACAPIDRTKAPQEATLEPKQEIQTVEAEVSPPVSRLSEHAAKCLFKCDKCGKAFQTEENLGTHKTKSKSRPFCCALCCNGFWTENQLQQHLIWHDEVRGRLPNEVRFRLSAAMTVKPLKPNPPSANNRADSLSPSTLNQPVTTPESQSQSSHKCQRCGKAFLFAAALRKHETQQCTSDSYLCSVCPRTFSEIQDLIDHHQECTGGSKRHSDASAALSSGETYGLTCLECGAAFCQETDLHQHYIEHARGTYSSKTEQK